MSGSDPSKTHPPTAGVLREQANPAKFETDLADLAARFAAQSGGGLSPELSADLALEIVLNEIVEQACLATGASGAAIVLDREGEMICRASSGSTAPALGSKLDTSSGLSGECFKTQRTQWCDDALSDRRADTAASERLGVRSVVVMPLLRGTKIVGVIELFSSQPYAFGVRDERTLEVLADRTLKNLDCAARPLELQKAPEVRKPPDSAAEPDPPDPTAKAGKNRSENGRTEEQNAADVRADHRNVKHRIRMVSDVSYEAPSTGIRSRDGWRARSWSGADWLLGAAAVACAILIGLVVGRHWGARNANLHAHPRSNKTAEASTERPPSPKGVDPGAPPTSAAAKPAVSHITPGGLLVLENGKEVFRVTPQDISKAKADQVVGVQRASSLEPDGVMELSPAAAEDSLIGRIEPDYPETARQQGIQGDVVLEVHIAADGGVQDVQAISGPPVLAQAAIEAVQQWKFKPRSVKGSPVEMETRITLKFRLPPQNPPQPPPQ